MSEPDWSQLAHELGPANDLPAMLAGLSPDPNAAVWRALWDRVYHQGSIYSASPHILPYLLDAARSWAPPGRIMPLALAEAIVASPDFESAGRERVVAALGHLARETADAPEISRSDRVYMMSAALTLSGDRLWGPAVEHLNDEEFCAICPSCRTDLYFRIGEDGCFTVSDFNPTPQTHREAIEPTDEANLRDVAAWLNAVAVRSGDMELSYRLRCMFGTSKCTTCAASIDVSQAIERFERGAQR